MAKPKSPKETEAAPPKPERKVVDWERIEVEYRAGQLSVSEIGRLQGVSHTAINKRARREGWIRDLAARVRQEVSARLVSEGVSTATQRETITECAERVVQIVREHRNDIRDGRETLATLYAELKEVTANREEIEETIEAEEKDAKRRAAMLRAVSLPTRASTALSLSSALRNLVGLERQAFSMNDAPPAGDDKGAETLNHVRDDISRKLARIASGGEAGSMAK